MEQWIGAKGTGQILRMADPVTEQQGAGRILKALRFAACLTCPAYGSNGDRSDIARYKAKQQGKRSNKGQVKY
jgi:hypothetical protein